MFAHGRTSTPVSTGEHASPKRPSPQSARSGWQALAWGQTPSVQTKLQVSSPGDRLEREADSIADRVVDGGRVGGVTQRTSTSTVSRVCTECEEGGDVQRKAVDGGGSASVATNAASAVRGLRGGGRALPAAQRRYFEPRLGLDLRKVRIHTGGDADRRARSIRARAFTSGHDIAFASGQYDPQSRAGRRLLAHELVHVAQQGEAESGVVMREAEAGAEELEP